VNIDFQLDTAHAEWILNAILFIHNKFLRNDMNDLAVRGNGQSPRLVNNPFYIFSCNLPVFARDSYHPPAIEAFNVSARYADIGRIYFDSGHQFRFLLGFFDG